MYAKVFSQIYDGTLCTKGPWEALVTFQQMLVLADQEGVVDMTAAAISRRTTIPLEIIQKGIEALLLEDPESRTPVEGGRRLLPLADGRNWGWRIVNYKHYRALKREEDRREYHREYWHKRKKSKEDSTTTQTTQHAQPNQPIAYAEAEAVKEAKASSSAAELQTGETGADLLGHKQEAGSKVPACPIDRLIDCYESELPMMAQVRRSLFKESKRAAAMRQRWAWVMTAKHERGERTGKRLATTVDEGVEWFRKFFEYAGQSDFLTGRNGKWNGCDIGFLMSKEKFEKVLEGGYANSEMNHA